MSEERNETTPLVAANSELAETQKPSLLKDIVTVVLIFSVVCGASFGGIFMYGCGDIVLQTDLSLLEAYRACPMMNNNFKPVNSQGIEHCIINAPFHEEIYKYTYWPNYREFRDKYYGKFEVIEKQMSHPINITFVDADWKEVEVVAIHEMPADDIANLIRSKGFFEHSNKDLYKNLMDKKKERTEREAKEKIEKVFASGTDEEKANYQEALDSLSITREEFMNPELQKKNQEERNAKEKAQAEVLHETEEKQDL